MLNKLRTFFNNFFYALKQAYNKAFKEIPKEKTQEYRDTKRINFLAIFVSKLNNLANTETTISVQSDSVQADRLKELCKDIEAKRFDYTAEMLAQGDCWVFPAHNSAGILYHRYVTQDRVRVLNMDGEQITDLIGIIDEYIDENNRVYFLNRRHTLNGDTLTIDTYITDEKNERTTLDEWAEFENTYQLQGVDFIGVGRFKSPTSSRGKSYIYGVPLNFGCEEIEEKIFADLQLIAEEFVNAKSKIFADPFILRKGKDKVGTDSWQIPENVFPIDTRGGQTGANIDIFSPAIRYSEHRAKLYDDMALYEQQIGTDKGFLTPLETAQATATEVRRANAATIALIDKIHMAVKKGVIDTLKADALFLNIADDLYTVAFDFYDAFEDATAQWNRYVKAYELGIAEETDVMQFLFPNMTTEEMENKIGRIAERKTANTDRAIERILQSE